MVESTPTSRRETLAALGAAVSAAGTGVGLAGCLQADPPAEEPSETLTVGVLQPLSTPGQVYGEQGLSGFLTGLAHKTGGEPRPLEPGEYTYVLDGVSEDGTDRETGSEAGSETETGTGTAAEIDVLVRDTEFAATTAVDRASELITQDGADVLYGVANTAAVSRLRTAILAEFDVPLVVCPAGSAALTRDTAQCHPQLFRTTAHAGMDATGSAAYLTDADTTRVGLVVTDDEFGETVREHYETAFARADGETEIVSDRTVATDAESVDWSRVLETATAADVEVLVAGVTDTGVATLTARCLSERPPFRLQASFGSRPALQALTAAIDDPTALSETRVGPFVSRYHWNQYDNPINDAFVRDHLAAYDRLPDLFTAGGFVAASGLVQALETTAPDPTGITETLRGMTIAETPKGTDAYSFRRRDNQARSPVTIAPLVASDEPGRPATIGPGQPVERVSGDRTLPEVDQSCDLR